MQPTYLNLNIFANRTFSLGSAKTLCLSDVAPDACWCFSGSLIDLNKSPICHFLLYAKLQIHPKSFRKTKELDRMQKYPPLMKDRVLSAYSFVCTCFVFSRQKFYLLPFLCCLFYFVLKVAYIYWFRAYYNLTAQVLKERRRLKNTERWMVTNQTLVCFWKFISMISTLQVVSERRAVSGSRSFDLRQARKTFLQLNTNGRTNLISQASAAAHAWLEPNHW